MTFSALDSELTGPLFATAEMAAVFSDRARLAAMLRVEEALARAEAASRLAPKGLAAAIRRVSPDDFDLAALGAATASAGVPAIPFVKALEAKLTERLRGHLHFGATSQDLLDTALVLQIGDALDLIEADLAAIVAGLSKMARAHRKTPQIGRTYGQHAAPITFGYTAAVWLAGIAEVAADLPRLRDRLAVISLDGPVGTLPALSNRGVAVRHAFAQQLNLTGPAAPWHTLRARPAEVGAWLAILLGALAKMAADVAFLASTEVGEVAEPSAPGRGGSSAMPHKQNPVSSTVILASHAAAAGHLVTLVNAMAAPGQRPAGAWHSEWLVLPQLFGLASGALREARRLAEGLLVDRKRMRANQEMTRGLIFAGAAAGCLSPKLGRDSAHRLVEKASNIVRATGRPLNEVLVADASIPAALNRDLSAAFDLAPAIAAAAAVTDRILAEVKAGARRTRKR
jgi:3-carboxy-cis,cis-muconate cycloisomerase